MAPPRRLCLVATIFLAATAFGQREQKLEFALPFDFVVQNTTFPAKARVTIFQPARVETMRISTQDGKHSESVASTPLQLGTGVNVVFREKQSWLVFHRFGVKYFLAEVWIKNLGSSIPKSKPENELLAGGGTPEQVRVNVKTR